MPLGSEVQSAWNKLARNEQSAQSMDAYKIVVVKNRCRWKLYGSCGKKYCSTTWRVIVSFQIRVSSGAFFWLTSLQTNNSNGSVVNIFRPKANRATLISMSFYNKNEGTFRRKIVWVKEGLTCGKLFRMFPWVLSVKTMYAEMARVMQETSEIKVDTCVTFAKRSSVGVRRLP